MPFARRRTYRALGAAVFSVMIAAPRLRAQASGPTDKSEAAVRAAELQWSESSARGDTATLNRLLAADYRSVNVDGTAHAKAVILAGALRRGSDSTFRAYQEWAKKNPYGTNIVINDDTAVVSFYALALGAERGITSADIFVFRDGRWQALYSTHTAAKP